MWIAISALNLAFAVMLGAFGAHGLKAHASPEQLAWWQTATDYFLSCAWIVSAWYFKQGSSSFPNQVIFLAYSDWHSVLLWFALYHGIGFTRILGAITPIGGALMIAGWLILAWNAFKYAK